MACSWKQDPCPPCTLPCLGAGNVRAAAGQRAAGDRIPRVGVDLAVFEGVSADVLRKGPGHVPGTAYPGRAGNCVIAGHRDSFFRRRVYVTAGSEKREYCLVRRRVVAPGEVGVLAPTAGERLTLLTCYPFAWVGPAPRRVVWQGPPASSAGLPQDGLASAGTRARPRGEH